MTNDFFTGSGPVPDAKAKNSEDLFTIGHSNLELPAFLQLLHQVSITALVDVRSSPFSQRYPQFNRPELEKVLGQQGIVYFFLGDLLGGRPQQRHLYNEEGRVDYARVRATSFFQEGLDRLLQGLHQFNLALMCSEEDPLDCHRGLMIAPALRELGLSPRHLRKDGIIESTPEMEQRLLKETGIGKGEIDGLFAAQITAQEKEQFLAEAYRRRARQKAFRLQTEENES